MANLYEVTIKRTLTVWETCMVEVEADDEDDARDRADEAADAEKWEFSDSSEEDRDYDVILLSEGEEEEEEDDEEGEEEDSPEASNCGHPFSCPGYYVLSYPGRTDLWVERCDHCWNCTEAHGHHHPYSSDQEALDNLSAKDRERRRENTRKYGGIKVEPPSKEEEEETASLKEVNLEDFPDSTSYEEEEEEKE